MLAWAYFVAEWTVRVVMAPVVARRRPPSAALAWLTIILFLPWLGLLVYLLIGENRLGRRRTRRHARAVARIRGAERLTSLAPNRCNPLIAPRQRDLAVLCERLGGMGPIGGSGGELLTDTEDVIDRLVADIAAAKAHVHLLFYIFRDDTHGRRVADALRRASERGVACRLLVDAVGSRHMLSGPLPAELCDAGVAVWAALPVSPPRLLLARIDLRNHRKIAVIDGRIGYAGSQNIVNPGYGKGRAGAWHDMTARLTGPAALQLQEVFCHDWYFESAEPLDNDNVFPEPVPTGDLTVQCVPSGPDLNNDAFQQLLVAAINEGESRIILTSPYLVPEPGLLLALRLAVLRGVTVDVIVPKRSDHPLIDAAARASFDELLASGVNIHLHQSGMLHSKTLSVDDSFALVGSGNLDSRSFRLNFELSVLVYGAPAAQELRRRQMEYMSDTRPLERDAWKERSLALRTMDNAALLLSPLL